MSFAECRICHKVIENKKPNAFYCNGCADVIRTKSAKRYKVGNTFVWIRNNQLIRAVKDGESLKVIFQISEIIE